MLRVSTGFAGLLLLALAVGCDDKKNTQLAPAASSLAPAAPPPPGATTTKFVVDPASKSTLELDAPKESIKAATSASDGALDIDLANIANSRGEVKVDLTTLKTSTFGDPSKDDAQTTH